LKKTIEDLFVNCVDTNGEEIFYARYGEQLCEQWVYATVHCFPFGCGLEESKGITGWFDWALRYLLRRYAGNTVVP
jgi:hypothetical protein